MTSENTVLDKLKEMGIVTEEQLEELAMEGVDDTMNSCADLMHTLICKREHEFRPEALTNSVIVRAGVCLWYAEQSLETCWQESLHRSWLTRCGNEMARQNLKSPKELHDFLIIVTKAAAEIHFLKSKYPRAGELLKELL